MTEYYKTFSNGDFWLTSTYFCIGQIGSLGLLYGEKVKHYIFQNNGICDMKECVLFTSVNTKGQGHSVTVAKGD